MRRSYAETPIFIEECFFRQTSWIDKWYFVGSNEEAENQSSFSCIRFPCTLSVCINCVLEVGLSLTELREPRQSNYLCKEFPRLWFWIKQAALNLFVSAVKRTAPSVDRC
jgi:hypothetical protein